MQFVCKDRHFLNITSVPLILKRFFLIIFAVICSLAAYSKPAKPGRICLSQPDGTVFHARFCGDEMMRIKVTEDGAAIVQDKDGWWCYAQYDAMGFKVSTGCRVGGPVSPDVILRSREIPFERMMESVSVRRAQVADELEKERGLLQRMRSSARSSTDTEEPVVKKGLVILVQFKGGNEKFTYTKNDFFNMLMQEGYSSFGADGSVKKYYDDQFKGKYEFSFDVSDIVTLDKDMAYYGANDNEGNDKNPHMMVIEACQLADADVDFAQYDQDGDGEVDNVFVFFAGEDEAEGASEEHIWSHAWYIRDGAGRNLVLDGVRINRYACASELRTIDESKTTMTSIGTFCHEYAHTLGLPDMYDTDYQVGGIGAATWRKLSLMDGGNYNNDGNTPPNLTAVEREILGLSEPVLLPLSGKFTMGSIDEGVYYRINSDNDNEYFLLECRTSAGWDRFIGGSGMLVYHVDKSFNQAGYSEVYDRFVTAAERWGECNEVNAYASHQCLDLVEADRRKDIYENTFDDQYGAYLQSLSGLFYPAGGVKTLTPVSVPGFKCWGDAVADRAVSDISFNGSKVSFTVSGYSDGALPVPQDIKAEIFQDAAILAFTSSFGFEGKACVVLERSGEVIHTAEVMSYESGKWACVVEGLDYSTSYTVNVNFLEGDYVGEKLKLSFMTKRKQNPAYPYIYLANVERTESGAFPVGARLPLRLFNARDAKEIRWTFNGDPVTVGTDCYYTIVRKGTLRAHILWEDGSEEVVMKEINVEEGNDE